MMMAHSNSAWHTMRTDAVRRTLATNLVSGLTDEEVQRRRLSHETHIQGACGTCSIPASCLRQLQDPFTCVLGILVLFGVYGTCMHAREMLFGTVLIFCVFLAVCIIGVMQNHAMSRTRTMLHEARAYTAIVVREGKKRRISTKEFVKGDVVVLMEGERVPADVRIVEDKDLVIHEDKHISVSHAVRKQSEPIQGHRNTGRYGNMAYHGTAIISGSGVGVVVGTPWGKEETEVLFDADERTYLKKLGIEHEIQYIFFVAMAFVVCVTALAYLHGVHIVHVTLLALALAVATLPVNVPAMVRETYRAGVQAFLRAGSLISRSSAIQAIGDTTVVLVDKTGVLTHTQMRLSALWSTEGVRTNRSDPFGDNQSVLSFGTLGSGVCVEETDGGTLGCVTQKRPLEQAFTLGGLQAGFAQEALLQEYPRLDYLPFTPERRFSASLHEVPHSTTRRVIVIGAPDILLDTADSVYVHGAEVSMTDKDRTVFFLKLSKEASEGRRVVAVAYREVAWNTIPNTYMEELTTRVVFVGLAVFDSHVHPEVATSVQEAVAMGVRVILCTGDQVETARAVARATGIMKNPDGVVIRAPDIDEWTDAELYTKLRVADVVALALPVHKTRIVTILKQNSEMVAFVGETACDVPALRTAHAGIALSKSSEIAKQSSTLVLTDDRFPSIVHAIREGRRVSHTLKKGIAYTMSTVFNEIILVGGVLVSDASLSVLPVHILWVAMLEKAFMHTPHVCEKEKGSAVLKMPHHTTFVHLGVSLSVVTGFLLVLFYHLLVLLHGEGAVREVQTSMFVAIALNPLCLLFVFRSLSVPFWRVPITCNTRTVGTLLLIVWTLLCAFAWAPLANTLSLIPLTYVDMVWLLVLLVTTMLSAEVCKWYFLSHRTRVRVR